MLGPLCSAYLWGLSKRGAARRDARTAGSVIRRCGRLLAHFSDELVAMLGACLAAARQATLAELAQAAGASISDVRLALRRLAEQLEPASMQVFDDGSHVQLAPGKHFHEAVAQLVQPERLPRLTQEMAEVLAIVIMDGMSTRRRIEEVKGAATLSIGPEGPVSLPRDSSETLALLLSGGLLCAEKDDHGTGRPLVYRPTPRLLQLVGVETLEEARRRMVTTSGWGDRPQR
jgi:chromosome segregation and condensation protein ScpB